MKENLKHIYHSLVSIVTPSFSAAPTAASGTVPRHLVLAVPSPTLTNQALFSHSAETGAVFLPLINTKITRLANPTRNSLNTLPESFSKPR